MKNLNLDLYEKDFTFIINGKEIKTAKFIADILSPLISKMHRSDPTFDHYQINIENKKYNNSFDFNKILNLVLNIGTNDDLNDDEFSQDDLDIIEEILLQLHNEDFYPINSYKETINDLNVFERITYKTKNRKHNMTIIRDEIDYISKNFYRFQQDELFKLPLEIIDSIISNRYLVVSSEDSLLEFIFNLLHLEEEKSKNDNTNDSKYKEDRIQLINSLFEHVEFIHISDDLITKFIDEFDIDYLTNGTWRSICDRFSSKVTKSDKKTLTSRRNHNNQKEEIENSQDKECQPIISYMYSKCEDPFAQGIVSITSSSVYNDNHQPINATKSNENSFYLSNDEPNQWIMYDFAQNDIIPYHYSLRSTCGWGSDEENICNWTIEVSNDGKTWIEIDRHEESQDLNGSNITKKFAVQKNVRCKSIRIRQIGKNTYNRSYLALSLFEIFGKII